MRLGGQAFWAWWTHELRAAALDVTAASARRRPRTILKFDGEGRVTVATEQRGHVRPLLAGLSFDSIAAARAAGLEAQFAGPVVVRVAAADTFSRTVELPRAAARDAAKILGLDLVRSTPFRPADVYTACAPLGRVGGPRVPYRQIVVKRGLVDPVVLALRSAGVRDVSVECEAPDGSVLPLPLGGNASPERRWRFEAVALAGLLVLIASAMSIEIWRLTAAHDHLMARTAEVRARAEAVRARMDAAQAAQADADRLARFVTDNVPRIVVLEEITRALPDTTWLVDLKIEDATITFSGLAPSAADLVPLLQKVRVLREPALAAPVTFDAREQRERFSIRAQLVKPDRLGGGG